MATTGSAVAPSLKGPQHFISALRSELSKARIRQTNWTTAPPMSRGLSENLEILFYFEKIVLQFYVLVIQVNQ